MVWQEDVNNMKLNAEGGPPSQQATHVKPDLMNPKVMWDTFPQK